MLQDRLPPFFGEKLQQVRGVVFLVEMQKPRDRVIREPGQHERFAEIGELVRHLGLHFGRQQREDLPFPVLEFVHHMHHFLRREPRKQAFEASVIFGGQQAVDVLDKRGKLHADKGKADAPCGLFFRPDKRLRHSTPTTLEEGNPNGKNYEPKKRIADYGLRNFRNS